MARIRSVKPEICTSETMARLTAVEERTFCRLWTHLDDEGRAVDNPRLIKAAIYPLHDDMTADAVDAILDALAAEGLIVRYVVDGKRYLAVPSWREHQRPQKSIPSKLPAPGREGDDNDPVATADQPSTTTRPLPDESRSTTRPLPDEYAPVVVDVEVVVEGEVKHTPSSTALAVVPEPGSPPTATERVTAAEFAAWWERYPRKVGRADAEKAYRTVRRKVPAARLAAALDAHLPAWATFELQFIPHPSTWLRQGRWQDPPPQPRQAARGGKPDATRAKLEASLARMTGQQHAGTIPARAVQ